MAALAQQNNNVDEYFEAVKKGDLHEVKAFLRDGKVLPETTNKVCLQVSLYCKKNHSCKHVKLRLTGRVPGYSHCYSEGPH